LTLLFFARRAQDPDLVDDDSGLCGPLEFMCCSVSACCASANYVPPVKTDAPAAPTDFKNFHSVLSKAATTKLAAVPVVGGVVTTTATAVLQVRFPRELQPQRHVAQA
jgi:hypothetical protein